MLTHHDNPARLYLPLLTSSDPEVRHQALLIMSNHHGRWAPQYLRSLLEAPEPDTRNGARLALHLLEGTPGVPEAPGEGSRLYIECLGRFRMQLHGRTLNQEQWLRYCEGRAGVQKTQALLAYLIHCGRRGASRATLDSVIWSRRGGAQRLTRSLNALRSLLAALGGPELAECLIVSADHCLLSPDSYCSDDQSFEQIFAFASEMEASDGLDASAPFYRQAVQIYSGPYMVNIPGAISWSRSRRERLAGNFIIACERLAELAFRQRRYLDCIEICQDALETDQTAEELLCWLLRAYAALGRRADLEHSYRAYERAMAAAGDEPGSADFPDLVTRTYRDLTAPLLERAVG